MRSLLMSRRDLDFLLYEWLDVEELTSRDRFAEHSRDTFDAVMDLCEQIATEHFAPHNKKADANEPQFDGTTVTLIPEVAQALGVYAESGLIASTLDHEYGGMQLPQVVANAASIWFVAANPGTMAYPFLTLANVNLLLAHASEEQIATYVPQMIEGRAFGTMCLSEPAAGSSLSDVATRAVPQPDGSYRLFGNKMWISGGDHELTDNIVHLVLARADDSPPGVKGLSLFIVPKFLVNDDGSRGDRNDVVLAGLNHKMGYRGTTNTMLNFGEGIHQPAGEPGAIGYLIGEQNKGLAYMFHMMNEARVGVGLGAVALGYTGYLHSLDYARNRPQGRPVAEKDPATPQTPIINHADVRRMLLAQKAYVEGGLALATYCGWLLDEQASSDSEQTRADAQLLLDVLTPIAKSWPSQWCLAANDLAIQVHGGYGYTREYNVEQFYRDNRLNPIHEGTHGIQGLDLLGRKVAMKSGAGLVLLASKVAETCERAAGQGVPAAEYSEELAAAMRRLVETTTELWSAGDIDVTLANASLYLEAFGHVVVAWMWLEQLLAVGTQTGDFYDGKRQACRYFFKYELPKVGPTLDLLSALDRTTLDVDPNWL